MANFTFLPSAELVELWYKKYSPTCYQEQAFKAYKNSALEQEDKDVTRFISARFDWSLYVTQVPCLSFKDLGSGAWSMSLPQVYDQYPKIGQQINSMLEKVFINPRRASAVQLLSMALSSGTVIYIPAYTTLTLKLNDLVETCGSNVSVASLFFIVETGAQVTLLDAQQNQESIGRVRSCWGLIGTDALVTITGDYALSNTDMFYTHDAWYLEAQASLVIAGAVTGGALSFMQYDFMLENAHASVSCNLVSALKENQQNVFFTKQYHKGQKTESSVKIKNVVYDTSRAFYKGTIAGQKDAQAMQADQQQRALLMSSNARVCAIPSLEIKTKEVQCRHGSAVGKVDADQLWYLQSRGFTQHEAQKLLVHAFLEDAFVTTMSKQEMRPLIQRVKNYCVSI